MADSLLAAGPMQRTSDRFQVVLHVDAETLCDEDHGSCCETATGAPVAVETARRLARDGGVVRVLERAGRPLSIGRKTRAVPAAMRRALAHRDRGCRFPGCGERRFVDAHHLQHWARGGETSLANLVQLCRHHHRLVHEGGYSMEGRPDEELTFRRPDGRRIRAVPPLVASSPVELEREHRRDGVVIRPAACVPEWGGERLDLAAGVDAMLTFAPVRERVAA